MIPVLEARGLTKRYGDTLALEALSFTIGAGEILCLLGANGAGKTTTLSLFLGFIRPDGGEALVCGHAIRDDVVKARRVLGYVPEVVALYPTLTGAETLAFFHDLTGAAPLAKSRRDELLASVDFPMNALDRRVGGYSKGMRQKLGLAIALAKDARAILLDEPLSGLDPASANEIVATLKAVAASGVALLISTHDIFRAKDMASEICILRHGRLLERRDPRGLTGEEIETLYLDHMAERTL